MIPCNQSDYFSLPSPFHCGHGAVQAQDPRRSPAGPTRVLKKNATENEVTPAEAGPSLPGQDKKAPRAGLGSETSWSHRPWLYILR